jgi:hypothetical protein
VIPGFWLKYHFPISNARPTSSRACAFSIGAENERSAKIRFPLFEHRPKMQRQDVNGSLLAGFLLARGVFPDFREDVGSVNVSRELFDLRIARYREAVMDAQRLQHLQHFGVFIL